QILLDWLHLAGNDPWMLAALLAVATLATEDGALVAGSLLVGSDMASSGIVIPALTFGIAAGDVGLYGLGWTARTNSFLRKRLPVKKSRPLRRWLKDRETSVLFFSRFTPGTRLITYVTFGFLRLSLLRFTVVMTLAATVWVSVMVYFVSEIQQAFSEYNTGLAMGIAFGCAVIFIIFIPHALKRLRGQPSLQDAALEDTNA
ncbi:MAG: VTT domain-containing protein, partial [Kordiimonadaceae bacterium]|nr:VTT domain-containing protein [Kordiimonadaceae bacterium]